MSKRDDNEKVERALRGVKFGRDWIRISCPFCEELGHRDRKQSMGVKTGTGVYACFRCGQKGRLQEAPDPTAIATETAVKTITTMAPPDGFAFLGTDDGWGSASLAAARAYVTSRGVDQKACFELQIGACHSGWWAGRILIPLLVSGYDGWLGWIGRLWVDSPRDDAEGVHAMKYLYPKGMSRGTYLYNHDALNVETDEPLIIVEGAFDAIPFWPNAAAVLGKPSNDQMLAMESAKRPIAFVMDGDAWDVGQMSAAKLRFAGARAGFVRLPARADPDEVDRDWLMSEVRDCITRDIF